VCFTLVSDFDFSTDVKFFALNPQARQILNPAAIIRYFSCGDLHANDVISFFVHPKQSYR
jgi:hypothetical protein